MQLVSRQFLIARHSYQLHSLTVVSILMFFTLLLLFNLLLMFVSLACILNLQAVFSKGNTNAGKCFDYFVENRIVEIHFLVLDMQVFVLK